MNIFYASERQRQIYSIKKNKLKSILDYNLQQMDRKLQNKQHEQQSIRHTNMTINQEALGSLMEENRRKERRRADQMSLLKESYERQMREKEERSKIQRKLDREFFDMQRDHMDYQESKRMDQMARIYNRATYKATPYQDTRRRIKTQVADEYGSHQPRLSTEKRKPQSQERHRSFEIRPVRQPGAIRDSYYNENSSPKVNDSLDNLNAQSIRYPQKHINKNINSHIN